MRKLWRRLYYLVNRRRLERELAEEMAAHRAEMPVERQREFGNADRLREQSRDAWTWNWVDALWQDVTYGVRVLWNAPGFTLGAIAVLALGVGVNLAEFHVFDSIIFHRITIRDADGALLFSRTGRDRGRLGFSAGAVEFYRAHARSFSWLVTEDTYLDVVVEGEGGVRTNLVSADYFSSLGVLPAWGRMLDANDSRADAPPVAVLGYAYWESKWGADPHVVGRVVHINNQLVQIVGVVPSAFDGMMPRSAAVWMPLVERPLLLAGSPPVAQDFTRESEVLFGLTRPGVSPRAAAEELTALTHELAIERPKAFSPGERIQADYVRANIARSMQRNPAIFLFIVIVLLVLVSACANLGNMLLARGLAREREIAIRLSIGAGRARIVRQLMTENFLLALLGTGAGMAFGLITVRLLYAALNAPPELRLHVHLTGGYVIAGFVLTFLSALIFGLPSALHASRLGRRKAHLRQGLVGVQVAVSCLLLIASGVLAHNGLEAAAVELAFDYKNMIVVYPQLYARPLTHAAAQQQLNELVGRMTAIPGVDGVTIAVTPPVSGRFSTQHVPGLPTVAWNLVASSYFGTMNLPFVRGRSFLPGEDKMLVVSESCARAAWPNQEPLGKVLRVSGSDMTVVGVVKDSGANLLNDADSVEAYGPITAQVADRSALILHTRVAPAPLVKNASASAAEIRETVSVVLLRDQRDAFLQGQQRMMKLIGSIGAVATALAAAGMFALVAFTVAQRKRELGIRIAIGAGPRHVLGTLLAHHVRPTVIGMVIGVVLAAVLSRLVRGVVFLQHQDLVDVAGFAAGLAGFVIVAVMATISPATRALRIDPSATLREE